jgi:hypothetical protein
MVVSTYQVIYVTQQVKFQMYLCNAFIEGLSTNLKELEDPIRNNIYQKEIESKLNMIIDRHCVFFAKVFFIPPIFLISLVYQKQIIKILF